MATFDRSVALMGQSFALRRFKRDKVEINHHYWTGRLASENLKWRLRNSDPTESPVEVLNAKPEIFGTRIGSTVAELKNMSKTEARWRKLTTVVLLASALERYLVGVAETSFRSSPTLSRGFPKRVDGLMLEHYGIETNPRSAEKLVIGEWSARYANFIKLFGEIAALDPSIISTLESMRIIRNQVAHEFGVKSDFDSPIISLIVGARRQNILQKKIVTVSDGRVLEFLANANTFTKLVDAKLVSEHIGGYEIASTYIAWKSDPDNWEKRLHIDISNHNRNYTVRFRKVIGELLDMPIGGEYYRSLERYVRSL